MAAVTALHLRALRDALRDRLGPDAAAVCDVFERYDGDAEEAADEHVADLAGERGASVLVGFLAEDVSEADEDGRVLASHLRPAVIVLRRRGPRDGAADGVPGATRDAEALDALYDLAAAACEAGGWRVTRGRTLSGSVRDWFGRALVVERERQDWPPSDASGP